VNAELIRQNLLSPMVLCFVLGALARVVKSDLTLPKSTYDTISAYLLLAIGLKGGFALAEADPTKIAMPVVGTIALGLTIPTLIYVLARKLGKLGKPDSGALAAHYGSVSAVTFIAGLTYLDAVHAKYEGFVPTLVAVMEIPGIVVGLLLAQTSGGKWKEALHEIVTGKSVVLLLGGLLVGVLSGDRGYNMTKAVFIDPFTGVLCLFLLEMGLIAANRFRDAVRSGWFLLVLGIVGPLFLGALGVLTGLLCGLSTGGATMLGVLSASASYIAAPAAVKVALPEASPGIYLTAAIGITFPFNLTLGIPSYYAMATALAPHFGR
jgi:uncharacterized protein